MDTLVPHNRARFVEIWEKAKGNSPLEGEEALFAQVMLEHREHHPVFDMGEAAFKIDFAARRETNPFLHVSLHVMAEQQVQSRQPIEAEQAFLSLKARGESRHDAIHRIGGVLAQVLQDAFLKNKPIDEIDYLLRLKDFITDG